MCGKAFIIIEAKTSSDFWKVNILSVQTALCIALFIYATEVFCFDLVLVVDLVLFDSWSNKKIRFKDSNIMSSYMLNVQLHQKVNLSPKRSL